MQLNCTQIQCRGIVQEYLSAPSCFAIPHFFKKDAYQGKAT